MYVCFICNDQFNTVQILSNHFLFGGHSTNILSSYDCRQMGCSQKFSSLSAFKKHLMKKHSQDVVFDHPVNVNLEGRNEGIIGQNVVVNINMDNVEENINLDHAQDNPAPVELENFVVALCENAEVFAATVSAIPNINRKNVTDIIGIASEFFSSGIVNHLKNTVLNLFSFCHCDDLLFLENVSRIKSMFELLENPFDSICTEYRRLSSLEKEGFYVPPDGYLLGHKDAYCTKNGVVEFIRKPAYGFHIPLRKSLKAFLQVPGMFQAIMDYMGALDNDPVIRNFVQGNLWVNIKSQFAGKIVLPIHLHCDDYEPNNVLGSHASDHSLGTVYATIASLPPYISSVIENMLLVLLYQSNDRKAYSNSVVFQPVVNELTHLYENGITLQLPTGAVKVFFALGLFIADNKANNTVQGFVEGFTANHYCRICRMHREDMRRSCSLNPLMRRNIENYTEDLARNDFSETGVKEDCVWNKVPSYHVTRNISTDLMHDWHEGCVPYALCAILRIFIRDRGYFSIETLHDRIDGFDFGPSERGNKPPRSAITIDRLVNDNLNLSASESLCLVRYLGEMIGDLVPTNSKVWRFYLIVREITEIVTSPYFVRGTDLYLETLIQEHHELYIEISKSYLKPKHHISAHMGEALRNNGPVAGCSSITSERKHRLAKMYARAMNSRVCIQLSVSIKLQLQLARHLMLFDVAKTWDVTASVKTLTGQQLSHYNFFRDIVPFGPGSILSVVKSVDIYGTSYQVGMIVVLGFSDFFPVFACIEHIIINENGVRFITVKRKTLNYVRDYCAFRIENTLDYNFVRQEDFVSHIPLWERTSISDGSRLISVRAAL